MSNLIRVVSICPCTTDGETGFEFFLNATAFQNAPVAINIDTLDIKNSTTGEVYSSSSSPVTLTVGTVSAIGSLYYTFKAVFTDVKGVMPEGYYEYQLQMDYTDSAGVGQNDKVFFARKISLCATEQALQKDLQEIFLSDKCKTEDCEDLKSTFWEAYTLYRALKIMDACSEEIPWDNSYKKLSGLMEILKKEACLNC